MWLSTAIFGNDDTLELIPLSWAQRFSSIQAGSVDVIKAIGNYAEIWDCNLGKDTPYKLPRGLSVLWADGGVLYPILIG